MKRFAYTLAIATLALVTPMQAAEKDIVDTAVEAGSFTVAVVSPRRGPGPRQCADQPRTDVCERHGSPPRLCEAIRWHRLAADQGYAFSQNNLGVMYANGEGISQDYAEAARWHRLAADQGDATAQFNLGVLYGRGQGVPQDDAPGNQWFRRAAQQGLTVAQYMLGLDYSVGVGALEDFVQAHMWFNLAAAQSSGEDRDSYVEARNSIANRMPLNNSPKPSAGRGSGRRRPSREPYPPALHPRPASGRIGVYSRIVVVV